MENIHIKRDHHRNHLTKIPESKSFKNPVSGVNLLSRAKVLANSTLPKEAKKSKIHLPKISSSCRTTSESEKTPDSFHRETSSETLLKTKENASATLISQENETEETFESFQEKFKEKPDTPLDDRIWSKDMINTRKAGDETHKQKMLDSLKLGSFLSDEAVFAMLKSYEDTLYYELRRIYPTNEKITRMNTQAYINLPRIVHKNQTQQYTNDLKREYIVSRQLERAMDMFDEIKRKKGEVTGRSSYHTNDLVGDYERWKNTCYSKISTET